MGLRMIVLVSLIVSLLVFLHGASIYTAFSRMINFSHLFHSFASKCTHPHAAHDSHV